MSIRLKVKEYWTRHLKSFVKTYVTVALGIYLMLNGVQGEIAKISPEVLAEINLTDVGILLISLKGGFLAVLRNLYKMLTEE